MQDSTAISDLYGIQLPARYELRRLEPKHSEWFKAIITHTTMYQNDVFAPLYLGQQARLCLQISRSLQGHYDPILAAGLSFGIFDKEYKYKRPISEASGGALYWAELNEQDPDLEANGRKLLSDHMDFPLVSVAGALDIASGMVGPHRERLVKMLPHASMLLALSPPSSANSDARDRNDDDDEKKDLKVETEASATTSPSTGQVMVRTGTATVDGYTGQGFMKTLSHYLMHNALEKGFKMIQIIVGSQAVCHVWSNAPPPFRAEVKQKFNIQDCPVTINGAQVRLFDKCPNGLKAAIYVYLQDK